MELRLRAMGCQLLCGITLSYLALTRNASKHTLPLPQPDRPVLDFPTPER